MTDPNQPVGNQVIANGTNGSEMSTNPHHNELISGYQHQTQLPILGSHAWNPTQEPNFSQMRENGFQFHDLANSTNENRTEDPQNRLHTQQSQPHFLKDLPFYDYALPHGGPINATIAEIIVIFPNWFRNTEFASRFLNNRITAPIHFAIWEEYHNLEILTAKERIRVREYIQSQYRKTMRRTYDSWTVATHKTPDGWDSENILINNFQPDAADQRAFTSPAPILFTDLAKGLKKLPQGNDAGDLTRALEYAMHYNGPDSPSNVVKLMFPTHLQVILDLVGRTTITKAHSDPAIIERYKVRLSTGTLQKGEQRRLATGSSETEKKPTEHMDSLSVNHASQSDEQEDAAAVAVQLIDLQMLDFDAFLQPTPNVSDPFLFPELDRHFDQYEILKENEAEIPDPITMDDLDVLFAPYESIDFASISRPYYVPQSGPARSNEDVSAPGTPGFQQEQQSDPPPLTQLRPKQ